MLEALSPQFGDFATTQRLSDGVPGADNDARVKEVAQEFEALLVEQLLDSMRTTVDRTHDPLDGGFGSEVFEDLLYSEYARIIAKSGALGIAELISDNLSNTEQGSIHNLNRR